MNNDKKCLIETNSVAGILWGKKIIKDAKVDNLEHPTSITTNINKALDIKKVSSYEIFFIKYIIAIVLIYFTFNINSFYVSMLGLAGASLFYLILSFVYIRFGKQAMYLAALPIPFGYLALSFSFFDQAVEYNYGFIFNYILQYLFVFYIFEKIAIDFLGTTWKNTYRAKNKWFRYLRFGQEHDDFLPVFNKQHLKWFRRTFNSMLVLFIFIGGAIGYVEINKKILINKKVDEYVNNLDKNGKYRLKILDYKIKKLGIPAYHRIFDGVKDYEKIKVSRGTELDVFDKKLNYIKSLKYDGDDKIETIAFIKDYYWYFYRNNKFFKVTNTRAR